MRTFIAIEIDEVVRRRIAELQMTLKKQFPRLRWSNPATIHLTLKFLGEVDAAGADAVQAELARIAASTVPFTIAFRQCGIFPPSGPPRVVWVGVDDAAGALARCRDAIEAGIAPLGFPTEDRPYRPHLTLARCPDARAARDLRAAIDVHRQIDAGEMIVRHLVYFQSTLTQKGPVYNPISTYELRG